MPSFQYAMCDLEISCLWSTWERNHVADILHAGDKQDEALETETETAVRTTAIATGVEIPPHILHRNLATLDFSHQFVVTLLTNRTTDDFANLWEQHIGALNGTVFFAVGFSVMMILDVALG